MGAFVWEEEGGVLGSLEPERGRLVDRLPAAETGNPPQWAKTSLSMFRMKHPDAELCLCGDAWRIEYGSVAGLGSHQFYKGKTLGDLEVWDIWGPDGP